MYILYTPFYIKQHDVSKLGEADGHLAYIEYFFKNNFKLPDFDPRSLWQFYHPPLHHMIAALWLKLNTALGMEYAQAVENIQVLTLFYSGCFTILCYKIFRELKLNKLALVVAFSIVCFHPTLIILSGSINNDILSITLMLAAILFTIRWYKNPQLKTIVLIALFLGLSMAAKLSGALAAPAIGVVFIIRLIRSRQQWPKLLGQFLIFGLICAPLGLWWGVYNFIKYGMPINYVPSVGRDSPLYIGYYPVWRRFFDFSAEQFKNIYITIKGQGADYNILISVLKNSIFGEFNMGTEKPILFLARVFFGLNVLMVAASIGCMIYALIKKSNSVDCSLKAFFSVLYVVIVGSFIKFCFDFPFTCTQNFRYIVPTFIIGALSIGIVLSHLQNFDTKPKKLISAFITASTALFCIWSAVFYTAIEMV